MRAFYKMTDLTKHNTICIFSTCWTGFSQSLSLSHTFRLFHAPALPCFLSSLALLHSFLTSISLYECGCAGKCLFHPVAAQMRQTDRFTPPPPSSHTLHSTHSIPLERKHPSHASSPLFLSFSPLWFWALSQSNSPTPPLPTCLGSFLSFSLCPPGTPGPATPFRPSQPSPHIS